MYCKSLKCNLSLFGATLIPELCLLLLLLLLLLLKLHLSRLQQRQQQQLQEIIFGLLEGVLHQLVDIN